MQFYHILAKLKSSFQRFYGRNHDMEYLCHKWPRICSTCRNHFAVLSSFVAYHQFVTRLTRRMSLVEQELLTIPEHLGSLPVFSGVRVTRSVVLCVCFVDSCLSFCTFCLFLFDIRFWLPIWYLQILLKACTFKTLMETNIEFLRQIVHYNMISRERCLNLRHSWSKPTKCDITLIGTAEDLFDQLILTTTHICWL